MSWGLNWSVRVPRNEHPWLGLEHLSTKEYAAPATMRVCTPKTKATTEREVTRLLIYRFASISFPSTACRFVTCCSPLVNYRRSLSCMHSCSGFLRLTMLNNDKMKGLTALPERGANTWFGWDATQKMQCISTTSNRQRNNRAIMNTCALTGIDLLLCFPLNRYYSSSQGGCRDCSFLFLWSSSTFGSFSCWFSWRISFVELGRDLNILKHVWRQGEGDRLFRFWNVNPIARIGNDHLNNNGQVT